MIYCNQECNNREKNEKKIYVPITGTIEKRKLKNKEISSTQTSNQEILSPNVPQLLLGQSSYFYSHSHLECVVF